MNLLPYRSYLPVVIQLLIWITLGGMLLILHPLTWNADLPLAFWEMQAIIFCSFIGLYYLNALVWVPRFLFKNKSWAFILLALGSGFIVSVFLNAVRSWLHINEIMYKVLRPVGAPEMPQQLPKREDAIGILFSLGMILLILFISTSVAALQKYQLENRSRQELEKAKISSELSFLKAQINPHFFFNTLNNIYSLTMFNVTLAQQALHTLSRMMRYVLYDTQSERTLLSKELIFVQDYIDLMKLRLTNKVQVVFDKPSNLQDILIAPMLVLPFVENAFKYGVSTDNPSRIYIGIRQSDQTLELKVINTLFDQKRVTLEDSNGIGLVNTRRRLDLLYPGKYTLDINENSPGQEYVVQLTLVI